jgi:hypothetical protein
MNRREVVKGAVGAAILGPSIAGLLEAGAAHAAIPPAQLAGWGASSYGGYFLQLQPGTFASPSASLSAFELGFNPFTVSLRFRLNSLEPQTLWSCGDQSLTVTTNSGQKGCLLFQGAQPLAVRPLQVGRWYTVHCVASRDPFWSLYVDGELWARTDGTSGDWMGGPPGPTFMPQKPLLIGQRTFGYDEFTGDAALDVADLRIWRTDFNADDALRDMEAFDANARTLYVRADLSRPDAVVTRNAQRPGATTPRLTLANGSPVKLRTPYTMFELARRVAPQVRLHSRDPYRPSSVDWYVSRSSVWGGSATFVLSEILGPGFGPPKTMRYLIRDWNKLPSSNKWGGGNNDNIGFCPNKGPGDRAGYYTKYQMETLRGEPIVNNICTAEAYVHITLEPGGVINFTYYFFYPYNGGMGPTTSWDAPPLENRAGFYAHIADWERVTVSVTVNADTTVNIVRRIYEWHGNSNEILTRGDPAYANIPFEKLNVPCYSCWHSHASWPDAGEHPTDTAIAKDHADDGPLWRTGDNLVKISKAGPPWVAYNGTFGINITVYEDDIEARTGIPVQKVGPEGPGFKPSFVSFGDEW